MGGVKPNTPILARLSDSTLTRLFIACNHYLDYCHDQTRFAAARHAVLWARRTKDAQTAVKNVGNEIVRREKRERTNRPAKIA